MKIRVEPLKVAAARKIARQYFNDINMYVEEYRDEVIDELLIEMTGFIYTNKIKERELVYHTPRATFFDWLFRRKKKVVWKVDVHDVLLLPEERDDATRIYNFKQLYK